MQYKTKRMALLLTVSVELNSVISPCGSLFFSLVDKGNELDLYFLNCVPN